MRHIISPDRKTLTILIDADEQAELFECAEIQSDSAMTDFFERLTCNSELQWIPEGVTGDLTSAPMLGILGQPQVTHNGPYGSIPCGRWSENKTVVDWHQPVLERWIFAQYETVSVLETLRDNGQALFIS